MLVKYCATVHKPLTGPTFREDLTSAAAQAGVTGLTIDDEGGDAFEVVFVVEAENEHDALTAGEQVVGTVAARGFAQGTSRVRPGP